MFLKSLRRGIAVMASRRIYFVMLLVVPLVSAFFFLNLMHEGLPIRVPVAMVDEDHSQLSRTVTRNLGAGELLDITVKAENYHDAMEKIRSGEIFGFFYIPLDFQRKALSGETPTLSFYSNMSIFVPGTFTYKGFKTMAVTTSGGIVKTTLAGAGVGDEEAGSLIMPFATDIHPIGNPCTNYSIYLSQSFIIGVIGLLAMMMTVFTVCSEIKHATAPQWLSNAGGHISIALAGSLLPQTVALSAVGAALQAAMFGVLDFPMHCPAWHIVLAMILMVMSCQAFALVVTEVLPNLRFALSVVSLTGILTFSIAGFSFPVDKMYGGVAIFSYILPVRYYFLIYIDQALNGLPLYFSRFYYAAMTGMLLLPALGLRRLRRRMERPVYVP